MQKTEEECRFAGATTPDDCLIHSEAPPECCLGKAAAGSLQLEHFHDTWKASALAKSPNQGAISPACLPTPRLMSCLSSSR